MVFIVKYLFSRVNRTSFNVESLCKLTLNYSFHSDVVRHPASTSIERLNNSVKVENESDLAVIDDNPGINNDALSECSEDVSVYTPYHVPSFNLAAYVNKSYTLQQLVKLGVNLHRLESQKNVPEAILKLDFEKDIKKYLIFLNDIGIPPDQFGSIITKCPKILFEDFENLKVRLNYLESKKFSSDDAVRIFTKNPAWFTWKTQDIDFRLGFFQQDFKLSGDEVRLLAIRMPKIVTYQLSHIKLLTFAVREQMGFSNHESKELILKKPKIYTINREGLVSRFDYLNGIMNLSHEYIVDQPDGLLHRRSRLEARHGFLSSLSRDQYDPTKPNYVSIKVLLSGSDSDFAVNVAKSTVQTYNLFLKSL